jgi:hypothetical protein
MQAAGGIISASLLSTPGASGFYKGGLTVSSLTSFFLILFNTDLLVSVIHAGITHIFWYILLHLRNHVMVCSS